MITLLSKHNLDFMPKPNEYHLILDEKLPPQELITAALGLIFNGDRFLMTKLHDRGWDIPGGHIKSGESPKAAVRREIYEETAVYVQSLQVFAYDKFIIHGPVPETYKYPCPVSYQVFYLGFVSSFDPFIPNGEASARSLLTPEETRETAWGNRGAVLYEAALTKAISLNSMAGKIMRKNGEAWDIYNALGEPQHRIAYRGSPLQEGDYHLVVQIWVKNTNGEYLIQRRAGHLRSLPGIWATTAGAVVAGENNLTGAIRELWEELGIRASGNELKKIYQYKGANTLGTAWLLERDISNDEITVQEEEVSEIMWTGPEMIRRMVKENAFYNYGDEYFSHIFIH